MACRMLSILKSQSDGRGGPGGGRDEEAEPFELVVNGSRRRGDILGVLSLSLALSCSASPEYALTSTGWVAAVGFLDDEDAGPELRIDSCCARCCASLSRVVDWYCRVAWTAGGA